MTRNNETYEYLDNFSFTSIGLLMDFWSRTISVMSDEEKAKIHTIMLSKTELEVVEKYGCIMNINGERYYSVGTTPLKIKIKDSEL